MKWMDEGGAERYAAEGVYPDYTKELDLRGSMGNTDRSILYRTPVDVGWDCFIDFSHDFVGKEALKKGFDASLWFRKAEEQNLVCFVNCTMRHERT